MSVPSSAHDVKPLCPDNHTAAEVAGLLQLQPLDEEGGFFRRTGESEVLLPGSGRRAYSVIYSLLTPEGFSAMHRLATDEIWCFHAGDAVESLRLGAKGKGQWTRLGLNFPAGEQPQSIIPARVWQGTRLIPRGRWALLSCIVAPEFRWEDFELGDRNTLSAAYPDFVGAIHELTRLQPPAGSR
jgi:predicted cupin superfamily sugar epimerase